MEPSEITEIIEKEITAHGNMPNINGIDLERCRVKPVKKIYENYWSTPKVTEFWLVLEEDPELHVGYEIVFCEDRKKFGLATVDSTTKKRVFLGYYGSFFDTLMGL